MRHLALILFIILYSSITFATSSNCDEVIYGNHDKYPKIFLKDGKAQGILVDILKVVGDKINCTFDVRLTTWNEAYKSMIEGKGGIIGLSKTTKRLQEIDYSKTVFYDQVLMAVRSESKLNYNNLQDLEGLRVITSKFASYGDDFNNAKAKGLFKFVGDQGDVKKRILSIINNEADVAFVGPGKGPVNKLFKEDDDLRPLKDKVKILRTPFKNDPNHLGFSKKLNKKSFLQRFNLALEDALQSGEIDTILLKY